MFSVQSATKMAAQKTTCETIELFMYKKIIFMPLFYFILFIMDKACYISKEISNFMIPVVAVVNNILCMQQGTCSDALTF
jgi:hypothetical protein